MADSRRGFKRKAEEQGRTEGLSAKRRKVQEMDRANLPDSEFVRLLNGSLPVSSMPSTRQFYESIPTHPYPLTSVPMQGPVDMPKSNRAPSKRKKEMLRDLARLKETMLHPLPTEVFSESICTALERSSTRKKEMLRDLAGLKETMSQPHLTLEKLPVPSELISPSSSSSSEGGSYDLMFSTLGVGERESLPSLSVEEVPPLDEIAQGLPSVNPDKSLEGIELNDITFNDVEGANQPYDDDDYIDALLRLGNRLRG